MVASQEVGFHLVESGIALEDGDELKWLSDVLRAGLMSCRMSEGYVVAPVGPESHDALVVELGLNILSLPVGEELDFTRGSWNLLNGAILSSCLLEGKASLSIDVLGREIVIHRVN